MVRCMSKKSRYTPTPEVPQDLQERYAVILRVLSGELTKSESARQLNMPRNHFQAVMNRALGGLISGLELKPPGPSPKPARERELETRQAELERENARLRERVDTVDRLLGVASQLMRGQERVVRRRR